MSNLIERRDRLRESVPHLATASGSIASFQTDMRSPLEEIKIHFNPVQSGSGNPSPTNVRPITGWTGCDIIISPTQDASLGNQIPVSWSELGTVHGGWINPINGGVWADWEYGDLGDFLWDRASGASSTYIRDKTWVSAYGGDVGQPLLFCDQSNVLPLRTFNDSIGLSGYFSSVNSSGRLYYMSPDISGYSTDQVKAYMVGKKFAIKAATPVLVGTISPITLKTLVGTNNIWANTNGNVDAKYWKH